MRRMVALTVAMLLSLAISGPALAKPSTRIPFVPETLSFPGGEYCDFDVELVDDFAKGQIRIFDTWVLTAGVYKGTLTNRESGKSLRYRLPGRAKFIDTDGGGLTITAGGSGLWFIGASEGDISPFGRPGLFLHTGSVVLVLDADGNRVKSSVSGRTVDICASLAS